MADTSALETKIVEIIDKLSDAGNKLAPHAFDVALSALRTEGAVKIGIGIALALAAAALVYGCTTHLRAAVAKRRDEDIPVAIACGVGLFGSIFMAIVSVVQIADSSSWIKIVNPAGALALKIIGH